MRVAKDKTAPARVARYTARNLARGLVHVSLWVPAICRDDLVKIAERMRGDNG